MSAPPKKQELETEESSSSCESDGDNEECMEYTGNETVNIDFEGRSPSDADFFGIKQLLQQLFLKAHLNLSELAELIIGQQNIGCVVKQSGAEELNEDDVEEEDDDDGLMEVFGVTSVINLSCKRDQEIIGQLRTLLSELANEHATTDTAELIKTVLADPEKPLGLIINERYVNIPCQISVPLLESLSKEITKAKEKNKPFDFGYYLFICKLHKINANQTKKKKNKRQSSEEILWSNPEEEIIDQATELKFEFPVETDSGLGGNWSEEDKMMSSFRRVLLFPSDRLPNIIDRIKEAVA
ncbi:protein BCCIP homolog [Nesidiocoris tenuis]|uniref:Protein BCCIP homolog n=1 Tax=Nesidiocoris tenuis TaxID=355587 RepID=A0ABN7AWW5_9HEMI|nr:protein BCCIP homolog [Nesidiocoris tenuis]